MAAMHFGVAVILFLNQTISRVRMEGNLTSPYSFCGILPIVSVSVRGRLKERVSSADASQMRKSPVMETGPFNRKRKGGPFHGPDRGTNRLQVRTVYGSDPPAS